MASHVDISGLPKLSVLAALYARAKVQGMGQFHYVPGPLPMADAKELWTSNASKKFDYVKGRVMKVDLSGDSFDPWLYDRDNGENAARDCIAALRVAP